MIEVEEFLEIIEELSEEIPQEFFEGLNGGVRVSEECKTNRHAVDNDLFVLGEYHRSRAMGNHIIIYYGSFMRLYGYFTKEELKNRARKTLRHEFRHHLEGRSGLKDLEVEDEIYLRQYLANKNKKEETNENY